MAMAMAWTAETVAALAMALVELAAVMVVRMVTIAAHLRIRDGVTDARQCVSRLHSCYVRHAEARARAGSPALQKAEEVVRGPYGHGIVRPHSHERDWPHYPGGGVANVKMVLSGSRDIEHKGAASSFARLRRVDSASG